MSIQVFCPFLNQVVCFLILKYMSYLYILSINPLWAILFANIFSHSVGYFHFVKDFLYGIHQVDVFFSFAFLIFIYLVFPGLSCGMWDLVPWLRSESRSPALGVQSQPLDHQVLILPLGKLFNLLKFYFPHL